MHPSITAHPADTMTRASLRPGGLQGRSADSSVDSAQLVARGPLAARAHRLLGLGPDGAARRGAAESSLAAAFGGDAASWQQVGNPWIAARSLASPVDSLPTSSTRRWLLAR